MATIVTEKPSATRSKSQYSTDRPVTPSPIAAILSRVALVFILPLLPVFLLIHFAAFLDNGEGIEK